MDLTSNLTIDPTFDPDDSLDLVYEPLQILIAITSVASALANLTVIYVILRFNILRTRCNLYLSNWALCNLLAMLFMPMWPNLSQEEWHYVAGCIWSEFYYGAAVGNFFFVLILLVDWLVMSLKRVTWCQKVHWYVMGVTWSITVGISVASLTYCLLNWSYPLTQVCYLFTFLVIFIVIIVVFLVRLLMVNVLGRRSMLNSKVEPIVVGSFWMCWTPSWILCYGQLFQLFYTTQTVEESFMCLAHSHGWIMLVLLIVCDKRFRVCLRGGLGIREDTETVQNGVNKEQQTVLLK
ncbi:C-C chemokine receptor type 1-like [Anthonomus grandis grandis]|uniref:C-C chemokine receptor type 1-like n=1 Tax=Anthonomus grandis grandis TaxID=2921223 RepID=UPI00216655F6|nr:C-C chemokine receptor type 1-like [Anthonomus grandis grandis]XP_050310685.1 C-C chemokine receptor type 1-like [Anthonomus grandis grandis]XP_050310686.1 C-C chemokine receptor type 1-like [Anthonomus grandis grandis]XP_050310687.1 C-C chemokine receptor type 1-like [Anthonomus grandis grandis]XP_050310689.1 C-C chemokine receptor type 1-like [Anthonomus grandis grandis]XP_050310690.1 C-C chemokine receptor type 1-like [Anthonomus grandis grandis]XP_050310691.1 C-C chemokine receptor typ